MNFLVCILSFLALSVILAYISIIDCRTAKISNGSVLLIVLIWVLMSCGIVVTRLFQGVAFSDALTIPVAIFNVSPADGIICSVVVFAVLMAITLLFEKFTGKFAMGGGDVKLLGALGLFLGFYGETITLLIACAGFAIFSFALKKYRMPFGPAIAAGAVISIVLRQML